MMTTKHPQRTPSAVSAQRGFTLVEMMVAIAIGLIVTLAVTGAVLTMGRQFRIVAANSAAQGSAQVALSLIDGSGRSAGAGLFANGRLLCPTLNAWRDGALRANGAVLMPVRLVDGGGNGVSDTVVFTGSNASGALSTAPLVDRMAGPNAATVLVGNTGTFGVNDLALLGAPGSNQPCTLVQITAPAVVGAACAGNATACKTMTKGIDPGGATGYNPPAGTYTTEPVYGFAEDLGAVPPVRGPASLSRIGVAFRQDAYAVLCGTLVQYDAFSPVAPTCTQSPLGFGGGANALATDVVLMHAQYGVSASAASDIVTNWVQPSGGTWANPTPANVELIKAIRVVIVARSAEPEGAIVTTACTNAAGIANTGPCSFNDANAPVIDLSGMAVPAGRTWQNYRYRVHQAVIPLRNVIWSN
jgi:type IV pilus assembly protein PilW